MHERNSSFYGNAKFTCTQLSIQFKSSLFPLDRSPIEEQSYSNTELTHSIENSTDQANIRMIRYLSNLSFELSIFALLVEDSLIYGYIYIYGFLEN